MRWLLAVLLWLGLAMPAQAQPLRIAMVTSLEASGLAPQLVQAMQRDLNLRPSVIITGSGRALFLLARGDVDLIVTHDPEGEQKLLDEGQASQRAPFMRNHFVLVGPQDDPARIDGVYVGAALTRIAQSQSLFISRGDLSGTHRKELSLWQDAGLTPSGRWYRSIGSGMAASIRMMAELNGYGLVDWASYVRLGQPARLRAFEFDTPRLENIYAVSLPPTPMPDAQRIATWLQGPSAQKLIAEYQINGQRLYWPANAAAASP